MVNIQPALSKLKEQRISGPKIVIIAASLITIAITTVEMWRGALTIGLNWDEPTHVKAFEEWRNGDWSPTSEFGLNSPYPAYTYGFSFQILASAFNLLRANENPLAAEAYAVRHLSVWVLFAIACLAVFLISLLITSDWVAGLFSAASLCALPTFVGHGFMNPVDTPPAVGYTLVSCGTILTLSKRPYLGKKRAFPLSAAFILILFGTWIAAGTRFAFWVPLVLTTAAVSLFLMATKHKSGPRYVLFAVSPFMGVLAGLLLVGVSHPHYSARLGSWLVESVFTSGNFPYPGGTLTLGQVRLASELDWWYLPLWVGASIPIGLLAFAVLGLASWLFASLRKALSATQIAIRLVVLTQGFGLGLGAIMLSATMYNAQRHHLYIYPSIAILAGSGLVLLTSPLKNRRLFLTDFARWGVSIVASSVLLYPTIEKLKLFPYGYVYLNELATVNGFNGMWESDYWGTSLREAWTQTPPDSPTEVVGPQEFIETYSHLRGVSQRKQRPLKGGEYIRVSVTIGGMRLPENCREVDSVTRNFRGEDVVMSWVGICKELPGGRSATQ